MATITATTTATTSIRCCSNCFRFFLLDEDYGSCNLDEGCLTETTDCCQFWMAANLYVEEIVNLETKPVMEVNYLLHACHQLEAMISMLAINERKITCFYHPSCRMLSYIWPEDDPCEPEPYILEPSVYDEDIPF